jgi:spore coat protein U-like protein
VRWTPALVALLILTPAVGQAASCTASSTGIAFGTYVPSSTSNSTGTVTISCSSVMGGSLSYTIALNAGVNSGGSFSNRRMSSGSSYLSYRLYTDATYSQVWGDGTGGTSTVSGTCSGSMGSCSSSKTVYGRIPALQNPSPGAYTDTITVTVTY